MKELAAACKKEGIQLCFYHSIMDWHHPDYLPEENGKKTGQLPEPTLIIMFRT